VSIPRRESEVLVASRVEFVTVIPWEFGVSQVLVIEKLVAGSMKEKEGEALVSGSSMLSSFSQNPVAPAGYTPLSSFCGP
jgi:hypothetical protein